MQQYVEIPTKKGTMRGFMHIPNRQSFPVVIFLHGFTGNCMGTKFSYVKIARMLEGQGIGSIRMNFLGTGESDLYFNEMTFDDELSCARIILEEMEKLEAVTQIYLLGHSMGGALACELAKLYPDTIKKICLWAPALNISELFLPWANSDQQIFDIMGGYELGKAFVDDIVKRDFYANLDLYQNDLLIIHGSKDTTVDYAISKKYEPLFTPHTFITIENGSHNFDKKDDIYKVIQLSYEFFIQE